MTPRRRPDGKRGKRNPLCGRCGQPHRGACLIQPGAAPGPDTVRKGIAQVREALSRALGRTEGP